MMNDIAQSIRAGKTELWKYDVRNKKSNSNDFRETVKEIKNSSIWKGEKKGQYLYYGFRYEKDKYYIAIDKTGRFEVLNYSKNMKCNISMAYEELLTIAQDTNHNAERTLTRIHIVQKLFKWNWLLLLLIQIISLALFFNDSLVDNQIPAIIATYIATILAMEDCFIIYAKRFQMINNRILMRVFETLIVAYDVVIILLTALSFCYKSFSSSETIISQLSMIAIFLSVAVTIGVLMIRRDAVSFI